MKPLRTTLRILEFWALVIVVAWSLPDQPATRISAQDPFAPVWEQTESERLTEACMNSGGEEETCIANEMRRSMGVK